MKKLFAVLICFALICSAAIATAPSRLTLKGWLVDNTCAAKHKADMASFVEVHDMSCARTCGKDSGFSLFSNGKVYPIVKGDTQRVLNYFGADFYNDTKVIVTAKQIGGKLKLLTIKSWK